MRLEIFLVKWVCSECGFTVKRFFGELKKCPRGLVLYGTMRNGRGYLEGGLDEAGSGRVLVLRRGGWDVLVGEKKQRDEGGEFRLLDGHLSDFMYKSNFGN